ncbi:PEP-CTERM sorting domain-containing protein [Bythopirellula polymerisocia]|uniref:DUF7901 domain-containing protein n=1 Tax=Bythopirellula polymerisocia TaxID=2528003 RepID=A0A5C6C818_9BACT|nr:PEP-CTERM sorting domain-containing protein [Bythopirellula polymerisocia]TWU20803.1 hypothetical protein Pla144_48550 [Bythopirellula polymerisocia]
MYFQRSLYSCGFLLTLCTVAALLNTVAQADPLPGQLLKFQQNPMIGTQVGVRADGTPDIYNGHDELSTAWLNSPVPPNPGGPLLYRGVSMADDFADNFNSPVVHISWWGSYLNNFQNPNQPVKKFLIAFEDDVPAGQPGPNGTVLPYSRPGNVLSSQIVDLAAALSPGSGTYTEKQVTFGLPEDTYKYNAELAKPFPEKQDAIYWLKIVALIDAPNLATAPNTQWGWHNRDYTVQNLLASPNVAPGEQDMQPIVDPNYPTKVWHFQDDAVESNVQIEINDPTMPNMPTLVLQNNFIDTHYADGLDGPGPIAGTNFGGIGRFSKDLAFELYTVVPEPSTCLLMLVSLCGLATRRR